MRYALAAPLVALVALITLATQQAAALGSGLKTTNCRKCSPELTVKEADVPIGSAGDFMKAVEADLTGGDGYSWQVPPASKPEKVWKATANFPRLCGMEGSEKDTPVFVHWQGREVQVILNADKCGKTVRCRDGSKCHESGLLGR